MNKIKLETEEEILKEVKTIFGENNPISTEVKEEYGKDIKFLLVQDNTKEDNKFYAGQERVLFLDKVNALNLNISRSFHIRGV